MKKLAILLVFIMMMSCFSVFASAGEPAEGTALFTFDAFGITDNNVVYLGTETDGTPDDVFGIALNIKTAEVPFCRYKFELQFDTTKLGYVACSEIGGADILGIYNPTYQLKYDMCNDSVFISEGRIIVSFTNATNLTKKVGLKTVNVYEGTMIYLYFHPLTSDATDTAVSWNYTECRNQIPSLIDSSGENLSLKLNGGTPAPAAPIVSLGAQANSSLVGLRFGATYNKVAANGNVTDLGMLLLPQAKLGDAELNLTTSGPVAKLSAKGIDAASYVANQAFADYTTFTFHCAVIGLTGHETDNIVARPFITYEGDAGTIYADALVKNYTAVLAAAGN